MRKLVCLLLVSAVLGEHHWLRGKPGPQDTLAAESAPIVAQPKTATLLQRSVSKVRALTNSVRGALSPEERAPGLDAHSPSQRQEDRDDKKALIDHKEFALMMGGEIFVTFACWLCLYSLCASYYYNYVLCYHPPIPMKAQKSEGNNYADFQDFKSGLCAWNQFQKFPGICFWSCLCPGIRWADTMSKVRIHDFWPAFWILTALYCISFIPLATIPCFVIVVCYMTHSRQKFREKFDFDDKGGSTYVADCFTYFFCMCCAVAQEARHSRQAEIAAHPTVEVDQSD